MKTNCTPIFIAFLLCFFCNFIQAQSPSIFAGEISYQCVGPQTYAVSLNVYADCSEADLPDSVSLDWSGSCSGTNSGTLLMPKAAGFPVDMTNAFFFGTSSCNGGLTRGVEHYLYTDTLVIAANCSAVNLSWLTCCRNDSLTSILSPSTTSFYLETTLDSFPLYCNSTVVFLNPPIAGTCIGIPAVYNHGAFDADGDSLIYSLVDCLEGASNPVSYMPGHSGVSPLSGGNPVFINPLTGQINYTVPSNETSMFCVLVEEVRGGLVIASTMREIAIMGFNCPTNNMPVITGIDSTNVYDTTVLVGQTLCFDIHGEDVDLNQQLLMSWNNGIAGATFTIDTSSNPIGTFCWTPTAQDTGQHTFVIELTDDFAPVPGVAIEQFRIQVNAALNATQPATIAIQNQFKIYPNPANKTIQISFDKPIEQGFELRIIDTQGKVVQEKTQMSKTRLDLDIHHLAAGLYSIIIITKEGQVLEQKLIVR